MRLTDFQFFLALAFLLGKDAAFWVNRNARRPRLCIVRSCIVRFCVIRPCIPRPCIIRLCIIRAANGFVVIRQLAAAALPRRPFKKALISIVW